MTDFISQPVQIGSEWTNMVTHNGQFHQYVGAFKTKAEAMAATKSALRTSKEQTAWETEQTPIGEQFLIPGCRGPVYKQDDLFD